MTGKFAGVDSLDALCKMPQWGPDSPLRVVTGCVWLLGDKQLNYV